MARYCGEMDSGPIVEAAEYWKQKVLLPDGSVLSNENLWNEHNLKALESHFIDKLDEGEGDFFRN